MYGYKIINLKINFEFLQFPPTFDLKYRNNSSEIESIEGYEAFILQTLSQKMNFTFELLDCNHKFGKKYPNGSWNGIVGAIVEGVNYNNCYLAWVMEFTKFTSNQS